MKLILFSSILISMNSWGQWASQPLIQAQLTACEGKIIAPPEPVVTTYSNQSTCQSVYPGTTCFDVAEPYSCFYYMFFPASTSTQTECSDLVITPHDSTPTDPPDSATSTEPTLPSCNDVTCPDGEVRTQEPGMVTCTLNYEVLEESATKKAQWDTQMAQAAAIKQEYDESQLYWNVQGFCQYEFSTPCQIASPTRKDKARAMIEQVYGTIPTKVKTRLGL